MIEFHLLPHPSNLVAEKIISRNFQILREDGTTRNIFTKPPLKDLLVRSSLPRDLPQQSSGTFPCNRTVCRTCPHIYILYINKSRLRIQLNSFSIFGAKLWNCLKPDLRKLRKQPFKNKIHQFLLAVLGNEDDYVDVSTLMLKITNYH